MSYSKLHTKGAWNAITRAAKKRLNASRVAVAYFGKGASRLLPLKGKSVLIVDFSEAAVRAGQVSPAEILKLIKKGVQVHSVANLHAKIFVFGKRAFIGSANASQSSANTLVEAVVEVTDPKTVAESAAFINSLRGEHITPEFAKKMIKLYKPPAIRPGKGKGRKHRRLAPTHARTWVVQLVPSTWDEIDNKAGDKGRPVAKERLRSPRRFELEEFCTTGSGFTERVKPGDLVVQVLEESSKTIFVSPPERILYFQNYKHGKINRRSIIYLEKPKSLRRKSLRTLRKALGGKSSALRQGPYLARLKDEDFLHRFLHLWPKLAQ